MLSIVWVQHAVGHGGFHTGRMAVADKIFSWVFDCGARGTHKFDDYLRRWTDQDQHPINWLFVSHFDTDHVSGLDELMSRTIVRDVMVPYVNDHELAYSLLYEIDRGNLRRSFVELVADPASFFITRGAGRVTFLGGGEPDAEPDEGGPSPDGTFDPDWKSTMYPPPRPLRKIGDVGRGVTTSSQVQVIRENYCDICIRRAGIGLRLRPYRLSISTADQLTLLKCLLAIVKTTRRRSDRPGLGRLAYAIALHARTSSGRAELRTIFKNCIGSSNRSSLSLLSIPMASDFSAAYWHSASRSLHDFDSGIVAWLNTGDSELLDRSSLAKWQNAYTAELGSVRVLALPHHGSDRNSDGELQKLCPAALLVAHAKSTAKKHPGMVVSETAGGRLVRVTEESESQLQMHFHLP